MTAYSYPHWPPLDGINIVDTPSPDDMYQIPRSQTAVFRFRLDGYDAVQIAASQTTFYDSQQCTICAWASEEINGRSITMVPNSNLGRIKLQGEGFHWRFYDIGVDPRSLRPPPDLATPDLLQWIRRDREYWMCFQNLQNSENGLYVRFTYLTT